MPSPIVKVDPFCLVNVNPVEPNDAEVIALVEAGAPLGPLGPCGPCGPCGPRDPGEPGAPGDPDGPEGP